MLQYKESRDIITSKKAARIAKIYDVAKQEAHDRTNNRPGYVNPDVKKNPVESKTNRIAFRVLAQ